MPRDYKVSLVDILEAVRRIVIYTSGMEQAQFQGDLKTVDAVVRNLEIIGEAAKNIPPGDSARSGPATDRLGSRRRLDVDYRHVGRWDETRTPP